MSTDRGAQDNAMSDVELMAMGAAGMSFGIVLSISIINEDWLVRHLY